MADGVCWIYQELTRPCVGPGPGSRIWRAIGSECANLFRTEMAAVASSGLAGRGVHDVGVDQHGKKWGSQTLARCGDFLAPPPKDRNLGIATGQTV